MRAVVQRVKRASVTVDHEITGKIDHGLLVYLGIQDGDEARDIRYIVDKTVGLRIFNDIDGKFNETVADHNGGILLVSQFTLMGDCRKGRRPSFSGASPVSQAEAIYQNVIATFEEAYHTIATGRYQAHMHVEAINDGPVTMLLDSRKLF